MKQKIEETKWKRNIQNVVNKRKLDTVYDKNQSRQKERKSEYKEID